MWLGGQLPSLKWVNSKKVKYKPTTVGIMLAWCKHNSTHAWADVYTREHACRSQKKTLSSSIILCLIVFRQRVSWNWKLPISNRLAGQWVSRILLSSLYNSGFSGTCSHAPLFTWVLEVQAQILMLVKQVIFFLPWSHLSSLPCFIF